MSEQEEPDYDAEMRLPPGKTCSVCVHVRRCVAMGYSKAENTSCDFWPNKFVLRAAVAEGKAGGG